MKNTSNSSRLDNDFEFITINNSQDLLKHKNKIFDLFDRCFHKTLDEDLWKWMYIDNPLGDAIVSLCYDKDSLIGHYGAILEPLAMNNTKIKSILSVGSMVDNSYRKYGIFVKQGNLIYEYCNTISSCVIGFPNKLALPARQKRLGWSIDNGYVALITKDILYKDNKFNASLKEKRWHMDLSNDDYLSYRLSKPKVSYKNNDLKLITKEFGDYLDIVYIDEGYLDYLSSNEKYYIFCDSSLDSLKKYFVFDYFFGYKLFDRSLAGVEFKKDLLMSDVF